MSSFKCVQEFQVNDEVLVKKYFSESTGLTIIIANMKGPVLHAYFVVRKCQSISSRSQESTLPDGTATEPVDDTGTPHALEHLIYGGSELYPYKGVIDIMANRYLSYGCAAVTNKDFTCFKLDIACNKGLNMLLPVYIDHILYPLLTEFCFTTEIYHINGEGKEGGVLHTKLLSREHSCDAMAMLELYRKLFPGTGYAFEAFGSADKLRELTIEQIRDYHSAYYRPDNLTIFISGKVVADDVLNSIAEMEEKIVGKASGGNIQVSANKWQPIVEPLEETIIETVCYPNDEESNGTIFVGWRGPNTLNNYEDLQACYVLLHYLCSSPISPVRRDLMEVDEPIASQMDFEIIEHYQALILIKVSGVPIGRVGDVDGSLMSVISGIANGDEAFDMARMRIIIQNYFYEKELNEMEKSPHLHVFQKLLPIVIYGAGEDVEEGDETFGSKYVESRFNLSSLTVELMAKSEQDWIDLLKKYFVENHHVTIQAVPSVTEQQKYTVNEQDRLNTLTEDNSETALELKQTILEESIAQNEENPPDELITAAELLATAEINYHWALRYNSMRQTSPPSIRLQKMPLYTEAYDLSTSFVYVAAIFSTDYIPYDLRMYLPLLIELMTNSPIQTDDDLIPLTQLSLAMEENLVSSNVSIGLQGSRFDSFAPFSNHFMVSLQVQLELYSQGVIWLRNLLYRTIFTVDRVKVCTLKLLNRVSEARRDEKLVCRQLLDALFFEKNCNIRLNSVVRQRQYLNIILEGISDAELADNILTKLNLLREMIINPENNVSLHIATDWSKLNALGANFNKTWLNVFPLLDDDDEKKRLEVVPDYTYLEPHLFPDDVSNGVIVGRRSAKSTSLYQGVHCIQSHRDIDLPALTVFLQYLTQPEGVIWRVLRGRGYAYSYSMELLPNEGLLKLSIGEANNIVAAYREMRAVIEAQLSGEADWNISLVESAKSTAIYNAVNVEGTITDLVHQSILAAYANIPYDQNKVFIKKLQKVTIDQLNDVGQKYLVALFSEQVRTSCVCPVEQVEEIQEGLQGLGINLVVQPSLNESVLAEF